MDKSAKRHLIDWLSIPVIAWLLMLGAQMANASIDGIPKVSYVLALMIVGVATVVGMFEKKDVIFDPFFTLAKVWAVMLVLGALHSHWEWIPALGFGQLLVLCMYTWLMLIFATFVTTAVLSVIFGEEVPIPPVLGRDFPYVRKPRKVSATPKAENSSEALVSPEPEVS